MEQREKDESSVDLGPFQEESDEIIGDYVAVENSRPEAAKKTDELSLPPIPEHKKIMVGRTLEEKLSYVWLEEKTLNKMGLKSCDGYAGSNNYTIFKDFKSSIYFFEKQEIKPKKYEYKLALLISP